MSQRVECPYTDRDCPKVEDVMDDVDDLKQRLANMERILYLIVGILTIELGVTII